MHDQVLQKNNKAAFSRADGKQQIDHADNGAVTPKNENAPTIGLFENQTQPAQLAFLVWPKIAFLSEQFSEQLGQFVQIRLGRRLDNYGIAHRFAYFRNTGQWQFPFVGGCQP